MEATIHKDAHVGARCQIGAGVVIGSNVAIGDDVVIHAGAVIGEAGFGFTRSENEWIDKDHPHGVVIGDGARIGANTVIHRGSWRHTQVCAGARIDAMVFIAHNVILRRSAVVVAGAVLCGSVEVGEGAWIGPRAVIQQRLTIGPKALIGAGAVVTRDVPENVTVAGCPARIINPRVGVREVM